MLTGKALHRAHTCTADHDEVHPLFLCHQLIGPSQTSWKLWCRSLRAAGIVSRESCPPFERRKCCPPADTRIAPHAAAGNSAASCVHGGCCAVRRRGEASRELALPAAAGNIAFSPPLSSFLHGGCGADRRRSGAVHEFEPYLQRRQQLPVVHLHMHINIFVWQNI